MIFPGLILENTWTFFEKKEHQVQVQVLNLQVAKSSRILLHYSLCYSVHMPLIIAQAFGNMMKIGLAENPGQGEVLNATRCQGFLTPSTSKSPWLLTACCDICGVPPIFWLQAMILETSHDSKYHEDLTVKSPKAKTSELRVL